MSMIIGKFSQQDGNGYKGSIATAGLYVPDVTFAPVPAKRGEGPDFVVLGNTRAEEFELGAAWAKTSKKDKPYLSVKIDGPTLAAPIHCALTRQSDGSYVLVWSRKPDEARPDDAGAEPHQQAA
jgi:uncharacterized protein (DUF736 family)